MANKPPDIRLAGIRASVPPGYLLGRVSAGIGGVELISVGKAQSAGLIPTTLPGPPTGAAGGDLSGTYPNPTVAQLQGVAVAAGVPTNLAVLLYHTAGATWLPVVLATVAYTGAYSDLSGLPTIPTGANPSATGSDVAVNGTAPTFMRSDGAPAIQKGSSTVFGLVKVDGTTITATAGVISSVGGSGGGAPASIKDDGTNLYVAMQDTAGQLVLDSSGNPIFDLEVLPAAAIPNAAGYVTGPRSAEVVGRVKGITDGSNAAAGDVGEEIVALTVFASGVTLSNGVAATVATLALTPGDWEISAQAGFYSSTTSPSSCSFGISPTTNTMPAATTDVFGLSEVSVSLTPSLANVFPISPIRKNVTVNTNMFLVVSGNWTGAGSPIGWGGIRARRAR